jgi:hypothetical protein
MSQTIQNSLLQSFEGNGPVHGTGIDIGVAKQMGYPPGCGTFSGCGWPVNGNNDTFFSRFLFHLCGLI